MFDIAIPSDPEWGGFRRLINDLRDPDPARRPCVEEAFTTVEMLRHDLDARVFG